MPSERSADRCALHRKCVKYFQTACFKTIFSKHKYKIHSQEQSIWNAPEAFLVYENGIAQGADTSMPGLPPVGKEVILKAPDDISYKTKGSNMAQVTFKGSPVDVRGNLPAVGSAAPEFKLTATDLSEKSLADFAGKRKVLNIFPSIDTGVCSKSVREFNERATGVDNTAVLCISADLPFALARFCGAEGIENVTSLSTFRSTFAENYGTLLESGPLRGLNARAVVVLDEADKVLYTELVSEIGEEPDYDAALAAL